MENKIEDLDIGDIWQVKVDKRCGVIIAIRKDIKVCAMRFSTDYKDVEILKINEIEFYLSADDVELDEKKLKKEIDYYLSLLNKYSEKTLQFKVKLIKEAEKLDLNEKDYDELENLLKMNKKRHRFIENHCKYCNSKLTQEQSLTRLELNNNEFEIISLKDKVKKNIEKIEKNIISIQESKKEIDAEISEIHEKISKSQELMSIDKYIESLAKKKAVTEITNTIISEEDLMKQNLLEKKECESSKRKLVKEKKEKKESLITSFETMKNESAI